MLRVLKALLIGIVTVFIVGLLSRTKRKRPPSLVQRLRRLMIPKLLTCKPNANHKLLGELAGTWNYVLKILVGPNKPPVETDGIVVHKPTMDGRYYFADFTVEILPGADGKLQKANVKGKSIEGYDNVK